MTVDTLFEQKVTDYTARLQRDLGIKGFQADGMFGNFGEETGGFKSLHQIGGNGLGWAQWDNRRKSFEAWCGDHSLGVESDEGNYTFLIHELQTTEAVSLDALRATRTRDEATEVFMNRFERPGVPALDTRIAWAKRAETARLKAEGSKPMTDTPTTAPVVPAVAPNVEAMAASLTRLELKLEDILATQAEAHGAPAAIVSIVEMFINKIDLPGLLARYLATIDLGKVIESLVTSATAPKKPTP